MLGRISCGIPKNLLVRVCVCVCVGGGGGGGGRIRQLVVRVVEI